MVDVVTELSEEFEANVAIHQGSVLSPFLYFSAVVDVVTELSEEFEANVGIHQGSVLSFSLFFSCGRCCN